MKIHPSPNNQNNITVRHIFRPPTPTSRQKKLLRLPHIFSKVLELPFYSNADVSIQETSDSLRFVVDTDDDMGTDNISAHTIEICPGVTKVVVRVTRGGGNGIGIGIGGGDGFVGDVVVNEVMVDLWRFRLPECTVPELATAAFSDGELVVVVPKDLARNREVWNEGNGTGRFVLVQ